MNVSVFFEQTSNVRYHFIFSIPANVWFITSTCLSADYDVAKQPDFTRKQAPAEDYLADTLRQDSVCQPDSGSHSVRVVLVHSGYRNICFSIFFLISSLVGSTSYSRYNVRPRYTKSEKFVTDSLSSVLRIPTVEWSRNNLWTCLQINLLRCEPLRI